MDSVNKVNCRTVLEPAFDCKPFFYKERQLLLECQITELFFIGIIIELFVIEKPEIHGNYCDL